MRPTRASAVPAAAALLLAVGQLLWTVLLLDDSGDGPAFAMVLVGTVALPTCLVLSAVLLVARLPMSVRALAVVCTAVTGLAACGVVAGVFVGDAPDGPAWIAAVATGCPVALGAAALLAGVLTWRLLRGVRVAGRASATVALAVIAPVAVGLTVMQTPLLWLAAIALPVILLVLRLRYRRHRPAALPA